LAFWKVAIEFLAHCIEFRPLRKFLGARIVCDKVYRINEGFFAFIGANVLDVTACVAVVLVPVVVTFLVKGICVFFGSELAYRGTLFGRGYGKAVLILVFEADFHFRYIDVKGYFFLAVIVLEGDFYCVFVLFHSFVFL